GLQRLVENLLYWGREQADNLFISQEEIPVRRIAEHVIYDFNSSLEMKNITLINNIPQEEEIFMDMNILKLVLRNLIANAIKFSHKEGVITLASTEKGICVSDNGVGIPEDKLNQLFDLKDGKSTKGTNGEEGTGLGLWLCQQILKKCSAKISVTSELDKGTTFFIDFEE
ncbi:MAG: sensor histidine kinase, partial [Saprospiraceae bacterium]